MGTDLLLRITSIADKLSGRKDIDDLERFGTSKIGGFSKLFAISACVAHFETAGDRPRQPARIFLKLSLDFNNASFDLLGSKNAPQESIKVVYPLQNVRF